MRTVQKIEAVVDCCQFHAHTATTDRALVALDASDEIIIKAASVKPIAQIARIEIKLRDYMYAKWQQQATQAEHAAMAAFRSGKNPKQVEAAARRVMSKWADSVARRYLSDLDKVYRMARKAGFDKAAGRIKGSLGYDTGNFQQQVVKAKKVPPSVQASFDLVDEKAVEAIQTDQLYWIGEHYDKNVSEAIRETTRQTVIETGVDRKLAAEKLSDRIKRTLSHVKTPGGFYGSQAQYIEGLVANAITNARAQGQIRSFDELAVEKYEIVNPSDRRTCPVCQHMNGKVFTVQHGIRQMDADMAAKKPDDIRKTHPWFSPKKIKSISPKPGQVSAKDSANLAKAGLALPPYHFRCRCAVDMA